MTIEFKVDLIFEIKPLYIYIYIYITRTKFKVLFKCGTKNINKIFEKEIHTSNIFSIGLQPEHNQLDLGKVLLRKPHATIFFI